MALDHKPECRVRADADELGVQGSDQNGEYPKLIERGTPDGQVAGDAEGISLVLKYYKYQFTLHETLFRYFCIYLLNRVPMAPPSEKRPPRVLCSTRSTAAEGESIRAVPVPLRKEISPNRPSRTPRRSSAIPLLVLIFSKKQPARCNLKRSNLRRRPLSPPLKGLASLLFSAALFGCAASHGKKAERRFALSNES